MKQFWFIVGSQDLYGQEVLETVAARAKEMADEFVERPEPAIINQYMTAYCEALEACLFHQEDSEENLLPF